MSTEVIENRFGFYELKEKPSAAELADFFMHQFWQQPQGSYAESYSDDEVCYMHNKIEQKYQVIHTLRHEKIGRMLDVGCGEGWALAAFQTKGWEITGLDFTTVACERYHPEIVPCMRVGNIEDNLEKLIEEKHRFECIWLENALEHALDPFHVVSLCRQLIAPGGVLMVEVVNNFSPLQQYAVDHGHVSHPFWVKPFIHLSYFNREGLTALCNEAGWSVKDVLGDYWIDAHLLNPHTNYVNQPDVGPSVHQTRLAMENLLHDLSPEKTNDLYRAMGALGLGRMIVGFFM